MKKNSLWPGIILFLAVSSLFNISFAAEKIYIDIDSPTFQLFPIAISDFDLKNPATAKSSDTGIMFTDEVRKYLAMSGFFNILNKKSYLEDKAAEVAGGNIIFANWAAIGADYLLKGNLEQTGDAISADTWLYDVIRGETLLGKRYQGKISEQTEVTKRIVSDILLALTGDEGEFNTKIAFVAKKGPKGDIYVINYDGDGLQKVTGHNSIMVAPRWSPDGRFLSFTSFRDGRPEVYLRDLQKGTEKKIASFSGLNLSGAWSPDGKSLLLTLSKEGNEEIYAMELESFKLKRLTSNFGIDVSPSWSPDGRRIAFVSNRGGSPQIYIMDADGGNVKRITYEGNYNTSPSWSPRGGRIAYEGSSNGRFQIFTIDEEGNNLLQLTFSSTDNESPVWSPSGRQIAFSSRINSGGRISIMNANGLNMRVLYENNDKVVMPVWSKRFK